MKEYSCVPVANHKNIGKTIEEWQRKGWRLNTYQATSREAVVIHYLLFERGTNS